MFFVAFDVSVQVGADDVDASGGEQGGERGRQRKAGERADA
jgi:hypothetical protein